MTIQEVIFTGFPFGIMAIRYPRETLVYLREEIAETIRRVRQSR